MELITITDAAQMSGKSIQTIRRMIKQRKVEVKKQRTPQGFNYLVVKESLAGFINQKGSSDLADDATTRVDDISRDHRPIEANIEEVFKKQFQPEIERFTSTIQKMMDQGQRDKENFFQLIKTFQDRIFTLEGHIKQLEAPKPRWWQFRK